MMDLFVNFFFILTKSKQAGQDNFTVTVQNWAMKFRNK